MREPPSLIAPETLIAAICAAYGLDVVELSFLPLGYDSSAWVYSARTADGGRHFLKLRAGPINAAALQIPHLLHSRGVREVVAPVATREGALWATAGAFALILYPFVDGATGMAAGLSEHQWAAYGAALRQIHAAPVPPELAALMRSETYAPRDAEVVRRVDAAVRGGLPDDPISAGLAGLWAQRRDEILHLLGRAEELGRELAARGLPQVLCHADIHTGNVLRDGEAGVRIVDWDEAMLAPKERDLMFAVGGISDKLVRPRDEALFLRGYGPAAIDGAALAYYRYAWAVSDIAGFSADILFRPDLGPVARAESAAMLAGLFAPGEIVAIARREERG